METTAAKPSLRIIGLHVEGYRALRRVDWPADGTGWNGTVPDVVMVGGVNGSGKTTLLELLANAAHGALRSPSVLPGPQTMKVLVDVALSTSGTGDTNIRVALGEPAFVSQAAQGLSVLRGSGTAYSFGDAQRMNAVRATIKDATAFAASDIPSIIYLPSDRRLDIPVESYKAAGRLHAQLGFFYRFLPAGQWKDSIEALLYSARWEDLNAKEEGHPERATHFESYARAFQGFFGDTKHLVWEGGELFVKVADTGALHPLMELSSGEKQALILAAELYRRWRPGSLILIDEPELHFHTSWQTALYTMLETWQRERGGQVIVATQSTHLFRIAAPGTTVLLGGPLA